MNLHDIIKARKHPRDIIIAPMFTEKSGGALESKNAYSFKVAVNANKIEIKQAIEAIFAVTVNDVNTMRYKGKVKRMGRYSGKRAAWKKAIVTVGTGNNIPGFEL